MSDKYRSSRKLELRKISNWTLSRLIRDEKGLTENVLVLIPTIILFLCVIQIAASVISRSAELNLVQGEVSKSSLYGQSESGINMTRKPLPGGGSLLIKRTLRSSRSISPLLLGGDNFESVGIAVDENS
jgi:hypothetical protein